MSVCGVPPTARVSRHELIRHRVALLTPANGDVADAWEPDLAWFYVVPIRVEDECGVVPRVIVRSHPRPSVVDASRLDGCSVERINGFAVWRGERNVHRKRSSSDLLARPALGG
jgi:hypothetical protein